MDVFAHLMHEVAEVCPGCRLVMKQEGDVWSKVSCYSVESKGSPTEGVQEKKEDKRSGEPHPSTKLVSVHPSIHPSIYHELPEHKTAMSASVELILTHIAISVDLECQPP